MALIDAYDVHGRRSRVPESWIGNPAITPPWSLTPPAQPEEAPSIPAATNKTKRASEPAEED